MWGQHSRYVQQTLEGSLVYMGQTGIYRLQQRDITNTCVGQQAKLAMAEPSFNHEHHSQLKKHQNFLHYSRYMGCICTEANDIELHPTIHTGRMAVPSGQGNLSTTP
jgi:hypothetical protein